MDEPHGDTGAGPGIDLTAPQRRILGCLVEKERATPQNYPLTLNSLRLACNQTTNRDPVTDYTDTELDQALSELRQQNLTRIVYSTSNRAAKYRHALADAWGLDDQELAVVAVLLLRGPQTPGEIKIRTERLADFADLGAVEDTLDRLADRSGGAFVVRHERRPGQKEARWDHLLGGHGEEPPWEPATDEEPQPRPTQGPAGSDGRGVELTAEVTAEVSRLRAELDALRAEFDAFRAEFG